METAEVPQIAQPKPTNRPKVILVAVLGFGLLAGSAYAGYWYGTQEISKLEDQISKLQLKTQNQVTPTPKPTPAVEDETKNWKTYTDTKGSYMVKYPSEWEVSQVGGGAAPTGEYSRTVFGVTPGLVEIVVKDDTCGTIPLKQCVLEGFDPEIRQILKTEDVSLDEEVGVKTTPTDFSKLEYGLTGAATIVTARHNLKAYNLWISVKRHAPVELPTKEEFKIFDLMLPTFKFLD